MANGKLLSSGFKGIAMLSQFSGKKIDEEKIKGYILKINFFFPRLDDITLRTEQMGRHIALALQAFIELQSFIDETSEQELNLSNAPILFHLQHDPEMLAYIQNCENDISNLNLSQVSTNTSLLDNAPNYLVGCIIQKKLIPAIISFQH